MLSLHLLELMDIRITIVQEERNEKINENKEFCDCEFAWKFHETDANGKSEGKTIPAFKEEVAANYEKRALTAENAAAIPCEQVLGAYIVRFERK